MNYCYTIAKSKAIKAYKYPQTNQIILKIGVAIMDENYFKADLHVHTPASKDWRGAKEKDEFIKILKRANSREIDLIAIADHNTVEGFEKITKRKNETKQLISLTQSRGDFDSKIIKNLEEEYRLFDSIKILMGIELKVSPGIHYTVIFQEKVTPEEVNQFLCEITERKIESNFGSPDFMLDIISTVLFSKLKERFGDRCLICAPHADSSSGLIRELDNFREERLNILKDTNLACIGFNKVETKEYVQSNLIPNISKERKIPLKFLSESDFHGGPGEEIGSGHIILPKSKAGINYQYLCSQINKKEEIKTFLDVVKKAYKEFKEDKHITKINISLDSDDKDLIIDDFCKNVCAILNCDYGLIEIDINTHGDEDSEKKIDETFEDIYKILNERLNYIPPSGSVQRFPLSKNKESVFFEFDKSNRLILHNNICFIFDSDNNIIKAESHQIESIVARKIYDRFGEPKDSAIKSIAEKAYNVKNSLLSFSIACKIENKLESFKDYSIDLHPFTRIEENLWKQINDQDHGHETGNLIAFLNKSVKIRGGRYDNCYLRATAPIYQVDIPDESDELQSVKKGTILVTPEGCSFLCLEDTNLISEIPFFTISIKNEAISPFKLLAYFKSTFLQWYLSKVLDYKDLFHFYLRMGRNDIPIIKDMISNGSNAENFIHNIVVEEKKFLRDFFKVRTKDDKTIVKFVDRHNLGCDSLMVSNDKEIFKILELNKADVIQIYQDIKDINIYDFGCNENIDNIYD